MPEVSRRIDVTLFNCAPPTWLVQAKCLAGETIRLDFDIQLVDVTDPNAATLKVDVTDSSSHTSLAGFPQSISKYRCEAADGAVNTGYPSADLLKSPGRLITRQWVMRQELLLSVIQNICSTPTHL
jgi:hypothetical protein